jgi:hypothetical protein
MKKKPLDEVYEDANINEGQIHGLPNKDFLATDSLIDRMDSSSKDVSPIYVQNDEEMELVRMTEPDDGSINVS